MKIQHLAGPLAVLALGLVACSKPEPVVEPIRAVRTTVVGVGDLQSRHEFAADIRAQSESRLSFRVGGKLLSRSVQLGDAVRAGQVLAQLDPQDLKLGADAAKAAVVAAQTQYEQAEADARRYRDLRAQGFIGAAEMDRREAAAKSAKAQWDQARAQASLQGNQSQYASLVADRAGVVTSVEAEPGQVLSAGMPVVRIAYDGPRDAVFAIPEHQVGALKALQAKAGALTVNLWGDATPHKATLREVAAAADAQTRTFLAKADVGAMPAKLGQTATVTVTHSAPNAALRLPLTAVANANGQSAVWVLDTAAMTVRQQPIVVATADGNDVLVASGLKAGEVVVTAGVHVLTPGQKVRLFKDPAAAVAAASAASR